MSNNPVSSSMTKQLLRSPTVNCGSNGSVGLCLTQKTDISAIVNVNVNSACDCPSEACNDGAGVSVFVLGRSGTTYLAVSFLIRCQGIGSIGTGAKAKTSVLKMSFSN